MKNKRKEELNDKWKQVATKAVTDDDFRKKLAKNPITVMKETGLVLPDTIEARLESGENARAEARSKRQAEQAAARALLSRVEKG